MINVVIKAKNSNFSELTISGHAGSGPKDYDLVCAGVSSVSIGALNNLDDVNNFKITIEDGYIDVLALSTPSNHDLVVLETLIISLRTLEQTYGDFINITERKM